MDTNKTCKKKGRKSSLSLYRRSEKFHITHPLQSKAGDTKHDDEAHQYHADDHVTPLKYKMHTTCGVQATSSMSKIAVASVQTKIKFTKSHHCQTESMSRKSVSTQYTKAICKENFHVNLFLGCFPFVQIAQLMQHEPQLPAPCNGQRQGRVSRFVHQQPTDKLNKWQSS